MRRAPARAKPVFSTVGDVQRGAHYAMHMLQGEPNGPRYPMRCLPDDAFDVLVSGRQGHDVRGIPEAFNYKDGVIRVWPWPAEGWQVWSEVSNKDVTP